MEVKNIPVDLIDPHPMNPRKDLGDISVLVNLITDLGFRSTIVVRKSPTAAGRYQLEAGHRRTAAAKKAGLAEVPAYVVDEDDDATAILALLAEQESYKPFTDSERSAGWQGVLALGDLDRAARLTGKDVETLRRARRGREAIDKKRLEQASLDELATLAEFEEHTDLFRELERKIGKGDFPYMAANLRLKLENRGMVARLEAAGMPRVERSPGSGWTGVNRVSDTVDADGKTIDPELCVGCPAAVLAPRYFNQAEPLEIHCDTSKAVDGHHYRYGGPPRVETDEERAEREEAARKREEYRQGEEVSAGLRKAFIAERIGKQGAPAPLLDFAAMMIRECSYFEIESADQKLAGLLGEETTKRTGRELVDAIVLAQIDDDVLTGVNIYDDETAGWVIGYTDALAQCGYERTPWETGVRQQATEILEESAAEPDDEGAIEPRACRVCHCTDEQACDDGGVPCSWVEDDLCSACVDTCEACKGDGRIPDASGGGHHGTCPECGGTGKKTAEEGSVTLRDLVQDGLTVELVPSVPQGERDGDLCVAPAHGCASNEDGRCTAPFRCADYDPPADPDGDAEEANDGAEEATDAYTTPTGTMRGRKTPNADGTLSVYARKGEGEEVFLGVAADSGMGDGLLSEWARSGWPNQADWDLAHATPEVDMTSERISAEWERELAHAVKLLGAGDKHTFHWGGALLYESRIAEGALRIAIDGRRPSKELCEDMEALLVALQVDPDALMYAGTLPDGTWIYTAEVG